MGHRAGQRIQIAFNPQKEKFDAANPALLKDTRYIADISEVFDPGFNTFCFVNAARPEFKREVICRTERMNTTIEAVKMIHPYKEPFINAIPLYRTSS